MKEQGNLILAIILSLLILLGFQYFFESPRMKKEMQKKEQLKTKNEFNNESNNLSISSNEYLELDEALTKDERIKIDAPRLKGSISLKGLKIDDLTFKDYQIELDKNSELVTLFKPGSTKGGYFSNFGWIKSSKDSSDY